MNQKIYIVEDEPDIRETLKYNFSNEGFKVFTAPDGEQALSDIKKVLPEVLILDLMLPGLSGLDGEVKTFLKGKIADYKIPEKIKFSDSALPRIASQKLDRVGVKNLLSS